MLVPFFPSYSQEILTRLLNRNYIKKKSLKNPSSSLKFQIKSVQAIKMVKKALGRIFNNQKKYFCTCQKYLKALIKSKTS